MKKIYNSLSEIVFPPICVCCGISTNSEDRHICSICRTNRFEKAGNTKGVILPDVVKLHHTMWLFDKGGYLQDLLHQLKYHYMRGIGVELGYMLGKSVRRDTNDNTLDEINLYDPIIVPVPLHRSKQRKRGYNQARALAQGVAESTGWDLPESKVVDRVKKTKTQTGLNLTQRSKNLAGAFQIKQPNILKDRFAIIVDDVFTTGATTFELSKTIHSVSQQKTGILSVARA